MSDEGESPEGGSGQCAFGSYGWMTPKDEVLSSACIFGRAVHRALGNQPEMRGIFNDALRGILRVVVDEVENPSKGVH